MKRIFLIMCFSVICAFAIDFKDAPEVKNRNGDTNSKESIYSYADNLGNAADSVVNISIQKTMQNNIPDSMMFNDPFFQQFFDNLYGNMPRERLERSLGSGVIISKDGYIVTNYHVIAEADKINVTISNNTKEYSAKLIGFDARSDIAIIKIEAKNLTPISFANSDTLMVGDVVFAIGNPFGVGESLTGGIISALNKSGIGINDYENFIQTDASINPGNSGGALVDSRGALVGINTAIISRTGGNHGIGFAIPANMVKSIAKDLIEKGSVNRGYLGVVIGEVSQDMSASYNNQQGALIVNVEENSPAAKAGIKIWDLIIEVNGKAVRSPQELKNTIGMLEPERVITIKLIRDKQEKTLQVKLAQLKDDVQSKAQNTESRRGKAMSSGIEGLSVVNLDSQSRDRFGIPAQITTGALVVDVKANSKGYNMGFEVGDVIVRVENIDIKGANDFSSALTKFKGKSKRILIYTRYGIKTIIVK